MLACGVRKIHWPTAVAHSSCRLNIFTSFILSSVSIFTGMKHILVILACLLCLHSFSQAPATGKIKAGYYLIAHRGGVVDSINAENSLPALQAAVAHGYKMVEMDMRVTKDGVLIINHDATFKKYYGVDTPVNKMNWQDVSRLKTNTNGSKVLKLEEVFRYCKGKIGVMIDNKIEGNDTSLFKQVVALLKKYKLDKGALMIGTDESTEFFTGKVRLSCTRKQIEENMKRPNYRAENYYLFGSDISKDDVAFAKDNNILAVGVINAFRYRRSANAAKDVATDAEKLQETGLTYFQIDSEFERYFWE